MAKKKESSVIWMIAKPFIGLCIPLLISAGIMFSMSGQSFSDLWARFSLPGFDKLQEKTTVKLGGDATKQQVYKWKDKDGVWHFSENAPAEIQAKEFESFTVSSQITTIQMPKPVTKEQEKTDSGSQGYIIKKDDEENEKEVGELASDPIELINQAKAIAEKMKQRNNSLDGI